MNKKAQINGVFLGAIIFVAILALYFIFINPSGDGTFGKIFNFFENTPDFNGTLTDKTEIGLIRYDIQEDKVQMYDGQVWKDFTGGKDFDSIGTSLTSEEIRSTFDKYYFEGQREGERELFKNNEHIVTLYGLAKSSSPSDLKYAFYEDSMVTPYIAEFWSWIGGNPTYQETINYRRGNVVLTIWTLNDNKERGQIAGFIYVGLNPIDGSKSQRIYIESTTSEASKRIFESKPEFLEAEMNLIFAKATNWRDSVFKEPKITLKGKYFCFRKVGTGYLTDGRYISIDLNKAGGSCNA